MVFISVAFLEYESLHGKCFDAKNPDGVTHPEASDAGRCFYWSVTDQQPTTASHHAQSIEVLMYRN